IQSVLFPTSSSLTCSSETMLHLSSALVFAATCLLVSTGAEKMTTCGNAVHRLSCETGVISVQASMFGRTDAAICATGRPAGEVANTACSLNGVLDIVKTRCNGKKACELSPATFPSDPCGDTFKYIETTYLCIPANRLVVCEQNLLHIDCPQGQVISIHGADFGRRDKTTCSYKQEPGKIQNVECSNPTNKVAERCQGRPNCWMRANNAVFDNTCANTYKYLEVAYSCNTN
ncbi:L-rhamnose-binding lectin SML-like, partial [Parambassis ranga]|uniref:L-rhamnose-binding lectin SML-like n=1 Tax=Parambassis ranga TaxID=210632 RepID=A0A6P7IIA7_9TELE